MRGKHLPASATRWWHGCQICFATFLVKKCKIAKNSRMTKAREKLSTDLESLILELFLAYVLLNLKQSHFS
jgi:hypothetical protein